MAERRFIAMVIGGLKKFFVKDERSCRPCDQGPLCIDIDIGPDVADGQVACSICLEEHLLGTKAVMLICGHYFHIPCYDEWKQTCIRNLRIVSCPNCRG